MMGIKTRREREAVPGLCAGFAVVEVSPVVSTFPRSWSSRSGCRGIGASVDGDLQWNYIELRPGVLLSLSLPATAQPVLIF